MGNPDHAGARRSLTIGGRCTTHLAHGRCHRLSVECTARVSEVRESAGRDDGPGGAALVIE